MLSRRGFLTGLIATAVVSAGSIPVAEAISGKSIGGLWRRSVAKVIGPDYVYQMEPGEILDGLRMPKWAKIIMAEGSEIRNSNLVGTQIYRPMNVKCALKDVVLRGCTEPAFVDEGESIVLGAFEIKGEVSISNNHIGGRNDEAVLRFGPGELHFEKPVMPPMTSSKAWESPYPLGRA